MLQAPPGMFVQQQAADGGRSLVTNAAGQSDLLGRERFTLFLSRFTQNQQSQRLSNPLRVITSP